MSTLQLALLLFGLAALGGATLLVLRLRGSNPPIGFALVHGLAAASGVVTLAVAVLAQGAGGKAAYALGLFVLAALGGAFLFLTHLRGRLIPVPVIFAHAALAAAGFVALLLHVVG